MVGRVLQAKLNLLRNKLIDKFRGIYESYPSAEKGCENIASSGNWVKCVHEPENQPKQHDYDRRMVRSEMIATRFSRYEDGWLELEVNDFGYDDAAGFIFQLGDTDGDLFLYGENGEQLYSKENVAKAQSILLKNEPYYRELERAFPETGDHVTRAYFIIKNFKLPTF